MKSPEHQSPLSNYEQGVLLHDALLRFYHECDQVKPTQNRHFYQSEMNWGSVLQPTMWGTDQNASSRILYSLLVQYPKSGEFKPELYLRADRYDKSGKMPTFTSLSCLLFQDVHIVGEPSPFFLSLEELFSEALETVKKNPFLSARGSLTIFRDNQAVQDDFELAWSNMNSQAWCLATAESIPWNVRFEAIQLLRTSLYQPQHIDRLIKIDGNCIEGIEEIDPTDFALILKIINNMQHWFKAVVKS